MKSPQATRISESRGRTELHTSNLIYVSHPSSSTSFGGVYPKAAHTGLLPCKAQCPEESKGLRAVLCPQSEQEHRGPKLQPGPETFLSGCSWVALTIGEGRACFGGKETAQVGADTWLWDLSCQKVIRGAHRRVTFQMSEGRVGLSYKRFLVEFDIQGLEKQ